MKDPKLLVSEGASDFERRWLSAARAEEPPAEVVNRIERALGIGVAAVATTPAVATATSATAATAKGGLSALRIAGLSALGVGGAVGLVLLLTRPSPPRPSLSADQPPPVVETAPAPVGAAAAIAPAVEAPARDKPSSTPAAGALRDEITLIDGARAALSAGSPGQALALLERYRARHPRGMLLPEALAMRIEAIDRSGDHARAHALARAFLADYPHSPLAQRVAHIARSDPQ